MAVIRDNLYGLRHLCVIAAVAIGFVLSVGLPADAQHSKKDPYSDRELGTADAFLETASDAVDAVLRARDAAPDTNYYPFVPAEGVKLIPAGEEEQVVEVRIVGNRTTKKEKILPHIRTRAGRAFLQELVEEDVRRLNHTGNFVDINVSYQHLPAGRVVIFEVVERPTIQYVKYIGNRKIKRKLLADETKIKVGDSLDPYRAEEARRSLELFYQDHGFGIARVTVLEGNKAGDAGVVFLINEGPKQKIRNTSFIGNSIASDSRLRTRIKAKHGVFWVFGGEFDRKLIEEDRNRLTAYYRGLGFFRAKIGTPEITFSKSREWADITWIINEGPRYTIRSVSVRGNKNIPLEKLTADLKLAEGQFFNQNGLDHDIRCIEEEYGSVGYIFADIRAEPRFLEEPGQLDMVYEVTEGEQYRVGRITPQITGDNPHTKITTVLNRISLQPGDIVDIRELRASKRRLRACGLFEVSPQTGVVPDIVISDPSEAEYPEERKDRRIARPVERQPEQNGSFRGQSPEGYGPARYGPARTGASSTARPIDLNVVGRWAEQSDGGSR